MNRKPLIWTLNAVAIALLALVMAEAARRTLDYARSPPAPALAAGALDRAMPEVDLQQVVAAHVFGQQAVAPVARQVKAPKTRLDLELAGLGASNDPRESFAIIRVGGKPEAVFRPGDPIAGTNARLYSVEPNRVLLDRNGTLESLVLERPELNLGGIMAAPAAGERENSDIPGNDLPSPSNGDDEAPPDENFAPPALEPDLAPFEESGSADSPAPGRGVVALLQGLTPG